MKVTISFSGTKIVVPCGEGDISVRELTTLATTRYKKAIGKPGDYWVSVSSLKSYEGGILDPDDYIADVCDDREQLQALFDDERGSQHSHGDGMSSEESPNDPALNALQVRRGSEPALNHVESEGSSSSHLLPASTTYRYDDEDEHYMKSFHHQRLNSPRVSHPPSRVSQMADAFESRVAIHENGGPLLSNCSSDPQTKGSLHVLRRREPLGASANKPITEKGNTSSSSTSSHSKLEEKPYLKPSTSTGEGLHGGEEVEDKQTSAKFVEVIIPNEMGPLGIHVVPCELDGRLVVQGIEPGGRVDRNGRLAVGDEVVEINGCCLMDVSFNKAQDIFKKALLDPELRLRVIKGGDSHLESSDNKENISEKKIGDLVPGTKITSAVNANNTRKIGKVMKITLTKGAAGLGFSITGRDNAPGGTTPIYIKNVLPKGAAIEEGNLKPGDRLLEVNSCRVDGMSQSEVVSLLRSAPLHSNLELVVSRHLDTTSNPAPPPSASNNVSSSSTHQELEDNPTQVLSPPSSHTHIHQQPKTTKDLTKSHSPSPHGGPISADEFPWKHREILTFDIPVHDTERAGLGVSVKGKTSTGKAGIIDLGIFVKSVLHGGAASRDGRLRTNDQLVNINGLSLLGKPNPLAMETLRKAMHEEGPVPGIISLTIARRLEEDNGEEQGGLRRGHQNTQQQPSYASVQKTTVDKRDSLSSLMTSSSGGMVREYNVSAPSSNSSSNNNNFKVPGAVRNPVIDRLMGKDSMSSSSSSSSAHINQQQQQSTSSQQQHQQNIRNESYYMATHDTFNASMIQGTMNAYDSSSIPPPPPVLSVSDSSVMIEQPHFNMDSPGSVPFARDQPGRQSMSEKRHATLDAKNTDTYQKRKKAREERLQQQQLQQAAQLWKKSASLESLTTLGGSTAILKQYSRAEREALKDNYYVGTNSVRVSRNRGCNESFRAAVGRSYEGGSAAGGEEFMENDLHHASGPDFEIEDPDLISSKDLDHQAPIPNSGNAAAKKQNRNSRFLKNLGTMFKISGSGAKQPTSTDRTKTLPLKKSNQNASGPSSNPIAKSMSGGSLSTMSSGGGDKVKNSQGDGIYDTLVPISSAMTRPGSRVGIADPGQNTGCSDYELIQRHLQSSRSRAHTAGHPLSFEQQQQQSAAVAAAYLRQQQKQQSQQSHHPPYRSRPKSNFYDYESWNFQQQQQLAAYGRYPPQQQQSGEGSNNIYGKQ